MTPMRCIGPCCVLIAGLAAVGLAPPPRRSQLAHEAQRAGEAQSARGVQPAGGPWVELLGVLAATLLLALAVYVGSGHPAQWLDRIDDGLAQRYGVSEAAVHDWLGKSMPEAVRRLCWNLAYAGLAVLLATLFFVLRARSTRPAVWNTIALCALVLEMWFFAYPLNRSRALHPLRDTAVHSFLRQQRNQYADEGGITVARAGYTLDQQGTPRAELPMALPPCSLVPQRIRDLHIYTFVDGRTHRCFQQIYKDHMVREYWPHAFFDDERLQLPFFDLLGLRYLLSTRPLLHAGERVGPTWKGPNGEFFVYERNTALPRAFVVGRVRELANEDQLIAALAAKSFHPRSELLLLPEQRAELQAATFAPQTTQRRARFLRDDPSTIELEVGAGAPGLLVLGDAMMSGWTATVNGTAVPITRGNLFCRVVPVPGERCAVVFSYRTPGLVLGLVLSGCAAAALLLLAFWRRRVR